MHESSPCTITHISACEPLGCSQGILAGNAKSDNPTEESFARQYNGVAPDALVAIDDIAKDGGD